MLDNDDSQIKRYQSIREHYREYKNGDIDLIPDYMKVYFAIERKEIDMLNKFFYAVMDYLYLDLEPCAFIAKSKDWNLILEYLDEAKENGDI